MRQIAFMRREVKGVGTAGSAAALLPHNNLVEGQMEVYDPHKTTTEVRQANRRLDNFWVLIISMVGVIALFAIIYLVFLAGTPPTAN